MTHAIMALNAGSSSVKFAVYDASADSEPQLLLKGLLDHHSEDRRFVITDSSGNAAADDDAPPAGPDRDLATALLDRVERLLGQTRLAAIGHRVVHGGPDFCAPVLIDGAALDRLDALTPMAPLHQPACLAPIRTLLASRPALPQVACFDTAFHHGMAEVYRRFPLPLEFEARGLRRYGFHGLSFEYIARRLERGGARVVVAHLGSGCSLCAMRDGQGVNTTMSLSPLDGLMMATRSGAIDPGLLLFLEQSAGLPVREIEDLLYNRSGLLGVSGLSSDMRTLLASAEPDAGAAIDQFCCRIAEQIAVMATAISGIDDLVFTGGVGEHSAAVRQNVCARLGWLGVRLDRDANDRNLTRISAADSRVGVAVIPTNEELIIAMHTRAILQRGTTAAAAVSDAGEAHAMTTDAQRARDRMVDVQIAGRGIRDRRVLAAMRRVPREAFVGHRLEEFAYEDNPLPIGEGQTISQPYNVALMLEAAEIGERDQVLEVGAGSGYATAVAAQIAGHVFAIERRRSLVAAARRRFRRLNYSNITLKHGDGAKGWPQGGSFDAIVVAAGGAQVPAALKAQLRIGGRLVMPIGPPDQAQELVKLTRRSENDFEEEHLGGVRFVPLVSGAEGTRSSGQEKP